MSDATARGAAELAARRSYGKLIAYLSARSRDVPAAEDALSEALATALAIWPERGIPDNPEAWLLVAARRNIGRSARHGTIVTQARDRIRMAIEEAEQDMAEKSEALFPDDRLKLLFVCAHPAIDRAAHTPLMLQTVLGLDAKRIASAFLVSPATMGQRLVRAKTKIRDAAIPFTVPEAGDLPARLDAVLSAIYAAYALGWDGLDGQDEKRSSLAGEAIWLARTLLSVLPGQPEINGLLSLMLYSQSRLRARRGVDGAYIPLDEQDPALWNKHLIDEADSMLVAAGRRNIFGPYQCEAAIQSVHARRRRTERTDWQAISLLYEALVKLRPTVGARIGQAAVTSRLGVPAEGLQKLDALDPAAIVSYQPYWAVRAHLLAEAGDPERAVHAYRMAIGLSESDAVRRYLQQRMSALRS